MFEEYIGFKLRTRVKANCVLLGISPMKIHNSILKIICVLDGNIIISDSFSDYLLTQNDIHIVNPTYPYYIHEAEPDCESTLLLIEIDLEYYKRFFAEITDNLYFTCNVESANLLYNEYLQYVRFLLAKIFFLYHEKEPSETELEKVTKELIAFLLQYFQHYIFEQDESHNYKILLNTAMKTPYDPRCIYRIIDYIYDHYQEKIKLEDLAQKEFLSTSYLSRYIKKASGLSFSDHVSMARCERAEELLITTNKTLDMIAAEVGFANRQHLTTYFKRWFKLSPSAYRKHFVTTSQARSDRSSTVDYDKVIPIIRSYLK